MSDVAQLLLPAIRWDDAAGGFAGQRAAIDVALELGVGGFIIFGGHWGEVRSLIAELRSRSRIPLLIGADLERGAGQQFRGATGLPPLGAIGSLNDLDALRRAARVTAREARALGVNWDYAPVCDLDVLADNPIVGTRALGTKAARVADLAIEWIDACQAEGVLACAKHFPGHGRTTTDSHAGLPVVNAPKDLLLETDLLPFANAIDAGVASIMTAHVAYPALDPTGTPATMSRPILEGLLRTMLAFDGLIVTDAMIMEGAVAGRGEREAAIRALDAGCDLLLYPSDLRAVARALESAVHDGVLDAERIRESGRRRDQWARWAAPAAEMPWAPMDHATWADALADRTVHLVRGTPRRITSPVDVLVVDDDVGGPYPPPSREPFFTALRELGMEVRQVDHPSEDGRRSTIIALFGDIRGWKGRPGYGEATRGAVARACIGAPGALIVQFSHPRLAAQVPGACPVLCAWGGEATMQQAAARAIARGP